MSISDEVRSRLVTKAGFKCSYCHARLSERQGAVDHIIPRKLNGTDDESNLAFCCNNCNSRKGERVSGVDPVTNKWSKLFNPKTQHWDDHFHVWAGDVCGKTSTGRATAHLLFQRATLDVYQKDWQVFDRISNSAFRELLTQERGNRLRNRFDQMLISTMNHHWNSSLFSLQPRDRRNVLRAASILLFERTCMMGLRAQATRDLSLIAQILPAARRSSSKQFQRFLMLNQAILLGHLATVAYLEGDFKKVQELQFRAALADARGCDQSGKMMDLKDRTRQAMLRTKYDVDPRFGMFDESEINDSVALAVDGDTEPITYLAAWAMSGKNIRKKRVRLIEKALEVVTSILERCGYGLSYNVGPPIILRRRWWPLQLVNSHKFDENLLRSDLDLWLNYQMHNEIRSLAASLKYTHSVLTLSQWNLIQPILHEYLNKIAMREKRLGYSMQDPGLFGMTRQKALQYSLD